MSAVHVNVTTRRSTHENRQWRNFWFWFCSNRRTLSGAAEAVRRLWHRLNRRLNSPTGLRPNTAICTVGAREGGADRGAPASPGVVRDVAAEAAAAAARLGRRGDRAAAADHHRAGHRQRHVRHAAQPATQGHLLRTQVGCLYLLFTSKVEKSKVFPYSLPGVGSGADPGVQSVSPQVT